MPQHAGDGFRTASWRPAQAASPIRRKATADTIGVSSAAVPGATFPWTHARPTVTGRQGPPELHYGLPCPKEAYTTNISDGPPRAGHHEFCCWHIPSIHGNAALRSLSE